MRYVKIFLLNFQQAFVYKGVSFIYFLSPVFNIGLTVLFWRGATNGRAISPGWFFPDIFTYYVLALVATQFVIPHVENNVATLDIHQGNLSAYLLKPFPYFLIRFFSELPFRFTNGVFGLIVFLFFFFIIRTKFILVHDPVVLLFAIGIALMGSVIAFIFKMLLGIIAFWLIEMRGLFEATEVVMIILMGSFMPLALLPNWIVNISYFSPFPYMVYFPIIAFEGKLLMSDLLIILCKEVVWIGILAFLYNFLWKRGIKKYAAVGQ